MQAVCVYLGASEGDKAFAEAVKTFGLILVKDNVRLVYGGGDSGYMALLAKTVRDNGGKVTGITPSFLIEREGVLSGINSVVVQTMHERKMLMFEQADAFVAMPGGWGTLEELVEQLTWAQIGRHQKPVLIANLMGYYNLLFEFFDRMREHKLLHNGTEPLVANRVEDILPILYGEMEGRESVVRENGSAAIRNKF
ncbi:TIGR00730 family Rossman fold protein [Candidatus Kaiserbacteria bacterium]|nr:TIGR00730 family Rossman fold protein [Candidatus Kaiserbacteria bacterium]